jgi:hypothetical protein
MQDFSASARCRFERARAMPRADRRLAASSRHVGNDDVAKHRRPDVADQQGSRPRRPEEKTRHAAERRVAQTRQGE